MEEQTNMIRALLVVGASATLLMTSAAQARNSDWPMLGASSRLTCGQFNKLGKVEKAGALSWALGYVSGMATSAFEDERMKSQAEEQKQAQALVVDTRRLRDLYDQAKLPKELELIAAIKLRCLERPSVSFPLMVEWTYVETPSVAPAGGREGFCAGEPNFKECVNADRGAKKREYHPDAYTACSELAEYVSRKERLEWERCLAKEDRAIKARAQR
jgi:HdeA/HdeB family